ncbi:MAG: hypothetical protein ABSF76_04955 [Opitutaceae bacterium]|jgi:hypothetical protein
MPLTPEEFRAKYPFLIGWIKKTIADHASRARSVASLGFTRLPDYFSPSLLVSAKVVQVDRLPMPPLSQMGLTEFTEWERVEYGGITYLDTFFITRREVTNEPLYFHELIHVLQWRMLGPERFIAMYADGLETFGYRNGPLETMAYSLQGRFESSPMIFDAEFAVKTQLKA